MKIDLSVTITIEILNSMSDQASSSQILAATKFGHIGTHFDVMDRKFPLDNTERRGKIFDLSRVKEKDIDVADIDLSEIHEQDFVIFHTGHLKEKKYGSPAYFQNYPELSNLLITTLVNKKVSMIGIDAASIRNSEHRQVDQYCADNGVFVIENLANLAELLGAVQNHAFTVHTYPINYEGMTGLPCRVIAEI
jgi:kynurenine formamidase